MKRMTALIVSAAVTIVLVATVLVVTQARAQTNTPQPTATATAPAASNEAALLQQQLNDAYTLMQQRDAEYQQRLQEAYAQLQAQSQTSSRGEHESREHESGGPSGFTGDD